MKPAHALLEKITIAADEQALSGLLSTLAPKETGIAGNKPLRVAFVNAHALNLACKDPDFLGSLLNSDVVLRDGSGMKILYKMLGKEPGLNLNGTDLIPEIIDLYRGHDVALLGTSDPWLGQAAKLIRKAGANPQLLIDGFQDDRVYLDALTRQPVSLVILAMGMPKQERVAELLAAGLDYPCVIVCGGAILDFLGGKVSRAPAAFRKLGMEWLYRLALEPRRMFRRYVVGNAVFLIRSAVLAVPSGRTGPKSFESK